MILSVHGLKSQDAVRMPTGVWPLRRSSTSRARSARSRSVLWSEVELHCLAPVMKADLVARLRDRARLIRVEHGGHRRHEERRWHGVSIQHFQDARNAGARAVLALADARKRLSAVAQVDG